MVGVNELKQGPCRFQNNGAPCPDAASEGSPAALGRRRQASTAQVAHSHHAAADRRDGSRAVRYATDMSCIARIAFLSLVTAAIACTPRVPVEVAEGEGEGEAACTRVGVGPVTFGFQDDVSTHFEARLTTSLGTPVFDHLVFQFFNYNERVGDSGIGTFALNDEINDNYGHCAECLLVFVDQLEPNDTPTKVFFQSAGSITLTANPRDTASFFGNVRGLKLVETTIGGETLESTPVPGGACLIVDDMDVDLRFVPAGWTCDPALYNSDDGVCDCDCGAIDADCFVDFGAPPPAVTNGCDEGQACIAKFNPDFTSEPVCTDTCDALAGVGCVGAAVCAVGEPQDLCETDPARVDAAVVGATCSADTNRYLCAVVDGIATGLCNNGDVETGANRECRPLCGSAADCDVGEFCYTIVGGSDDGSGKGWCEPGTAP